MEGIGVGPIGLSVVIVDNFADGDFKIFYETCVGLHFVNFYVNVFSSQIKETSVKV